MWRFPVVFCGSVQTLLQHFEGIVLVHIVVDIVSLCYSDLLDIHHHYFWGVDTLITSSGVMAVSSHISCIFISVFTFGHRRPGLWERVSYYSGCVWFIFSALILYHVDIDDGVGLVEIILTTICI